MAENTKPQPPSGATSKAKVHDGFRQRLTDLMAQSNVFAEAFKRAGQRGWNVPSNLTAPHLFAIAELHKPAFDRQGPNDNYLECFQNAADMGTVGDVIGLKLQIDYVAAEERQFRFRHASTCRNICHAMSRRRALADGPVFREIEKQVGDVIRTGAKRTGTA